MRRKQIPVFINLMAIARYDGMTAFPIQFMTRGFLEMLPDSRSVLKYTENLIDEDSGETTQNKVIMTILPGRITMERSGDITNTMVFVRGQRYEGT